MKPKPQKFAAKDVLALLAKKHEADVFVPECKDGPSWGGNHFRLDAWTMNRSWTSAKVTGYEIKVNRSDFVQDNKWQAYLACCNELYFVCPAGLIEPSELSPQVGLLWVSSTGNTLVTKKKAHFRDIEIPESVWRYIVMCRTKIVSRQHFEPPDRLEYWRNWLAEKEESRTIGWQASKKVTEYCQRIERENRELKQKHERYESLRQVLQELGFQHDYPYTNEVRNRVNQLRGEIPAFVENEIANFKRAMERFETTLKSYSNELNKEAEKNAA